MMKVRHFHGTRCGAAFRKSRPGEWFLNGLCLAMAAGFMIIFTSALNSAEPAGEERPTFRMPPIKGFKVAIDQLRLTGDARMVESSLFEISNIQGEVLREDRVEMIVETAGCFYDRSANRLYSDETVTANSVDGRLAFQGRGFSYTRETGELRIENDVHTRLNRSGLNLTNLMELPQEDIRTNQFIEIESGLLSYDTANSRIEYGEGVHIYEGDWLDLKSVQLAIELASEGEQPFRSITARHDVMASIQQTNRQLQVWGDLATYTRDAEKRDWLEVAGKARWSSDPYSGAGDRLVLNYSTNDYSVMMLGNASLRVPARLNATNDPDNAEDMLWVDATGDRYQYEGGRMDFVGRVQARQGTNWLIRAGRLTGNLDASNRLEQVAAKEGVTVYFSGEEDTGEGRAQEAVYSIAGDQTEQLRLLGKPEWRSRRIETSAETIQVDNPRTQPSLVARKNARLVLLNIPMGSLDMLPTTATNQTASAADATVSDADENQETNILERLTITSNEYRYHSNLLEFAGSVRATDGESVVATDLLKVWVDEEARQLTGMEAVGQVVLTRDSDRLSADRIQAEFDPETGDLSGFRAEGNIQLDSPEATGSCETAIYDVAANEVTFLGEPRFEKIEYLENYTKRRIARARGNRIVWNVKNNQVSSVPYNIEFEVEPVPESERPVNPER